MAYHNNGVMVENIKDLIEIWDFDKNTIVKLDPKTLPVNSCKEAFWLCKNGHSWKEKISRVYGRKQKCLFCSGRIVVSGENDLQTLYPKIADEWDTDKNGITSNRISPRDTNSYWWKCNNGHPGFKRSVWHRVSRNDICPFCSGKKVIPGVNDLETLYPKIADEWDYENNNGVKPSEVLADSWIKYNWICPKGHHYSMKVHLRTHSIKPIDCPKCTKAHSTSFPEQAIYYYTKQFYPEAINRYRGLTQSGLELDIFIPTWNIGIEYDGKPFHSSEEAKLKEQLKYNICKEKGIKLIRVKEGEFEQFFDSAADETFYIKKRPNDSEMDYFLISFFSRLTMWSHNHYYFYKNPLTNQTEVTFGLPVDINIKRDRPRILEYLIDVERSFGTIYPELAKNWDYESNGKLTPFMLTPGSNHEAFFKCERCGKKWSAAISTVTKWKRSMCKKCSMEDNGLHQTKRIVRISGSLGEKHPELIEQWDTEVNGELTPFDVPTAYSKKVFWKCPICNYKWSLSPQRRIHNNKVSGCPHCSGRVAMPGVDDLKTLYPDIAKEWDYDKNGNVLPSQVRPHSGTPRYWICSKHNISYKTAPHYRVKGGGCVICKGEKIRNKKGFKIEQYSKSLEHINTYKSINEAGHALGISPEAIRLAANNGALSGGYYWKYEGSKFTVLKPDKKHAVIAVNVKTGETHEYESAREAERQTGIRHNSIMNCCKKSEKYNTAGGFYWHFKDSKLEIRKNKTTSIRVVGTNCKTNESVVFESITKASRVLGLDKSRIGECCSGKNPNRKTTGGYRWRYANDDDFKKHA